ncbi:hypothetical protein NDA07_26125 [Microcoleus vaginatus DQ-U2]|uniref:hypothetical protein n=1 Tax=Microcoleus vaginatus TaxID=119532 RepID=UPI001685BDE3|nr:hypothetical protein [Microcoleus sp. FACHB-DQ6]
MDSTIIHHYTSTFPLLYYARHLKSYQLHPLVGEKGEYLLSQHPENLRTAHSQAYHYYISIPLKPE